MSNYESRLNDFAQGKRLLRLPRPVRAWADASCDACGSSQPRTLYGVKDLGAQRYYFVGDTCLQELVQRGAVLSRYGKEAGQKVYQGEMRRRAQELAGDSYVQKPDGAAPPGPKAASIDSHQGAGPSQPKDLQPLFPVVLVIADPDHYRAVVSLISALGVLQGSGQAQEPRYEEVWRMGQETELVLEQVKEERPDAFGQCLARAWQEALARCQRPVSVPIPTDQSKGKGHLPPGSKAGPTVAPVQLWSTVAGSYSAINGGNGPEAPK